MNGCSLRAVKAVAKQTIDNLRSMGMAMTPCILPGVGTAGFQLGDDEIEIGMGIHGEPGIKREPLVTAKALAKKLVGEILADYEFSGKTAVMINGLGGTPLMELYILFGEVKALLTEHGIEVCRAFVGNYMTSLEMAGCSVSLIKLDSRLEQLLDAPSETIAFKITRR